MTNKPNVSFSGYGYCGNCDVEWEFGPVPDGTILESEHECEDPETLRKRH